MDVVLLQVTMMRTRGELVLHMGKRAATG